MAYKICPNCRMANKEHAKKCIHCGRTISSDAEFCPFCGTNQSGTTTKTLEPKKWKCLNCGKIATDPVVDNLTKFCINCGSQNIVKY